MPGKDNRRDSPSFRSLLPMPGHGVCTPEEKKKERRRSTEAQRVVEVYLENLHLLRNGHSRKQTKIFTCCTVTLENKRKSSLIAQRSLSKTVFTYCTVTLENKRKSSLIAQRSLSKTNENLHLLHGHSRKQTNIQIIFISDDACIAMHVDIQNIHAQLREHTESWVLTAKLCSKTSTPFRSPSTRRFSEKKKQFFSGKQFHWSQQL